MKLLRAQEAEKDFRPTGPSVMDKKSPGAFGVYFCRLLMNFNR